MTLPPATTPLYNHPLPEIEQWLTSKGCQQDKDNLHCWYLQQDPWEAEIELEVDCLTVRYLKADDERDVTRSFKYSLSREDLEAAIFAGP